MTYKLFIHRTALLVFLPLVFGCVAIIGILNAIPETYDFIKTNWPTTFPRCPRCNALIDGQSLPKSDESGCNMCWAVRHGLK